MRNFVYFLLTLSCFAADVSTLRKPLTLAFEARQDEFVSHGPGYSLSVNSTGANLNLSGHELRLRLAGADPRPTLEPLDRMPGRTNYILGHDIRRSYELFGRVRSRGVYRGVDMIFRGNQERLEYDFEIAAGRDPGQIKVDFEGAGEVHIDPDGALLLRAGAFEIRQPAPVAYQVIDGRHVPVTAAYRLDVAHQVRFRIGRYDRTQALVIDPQLVFENLFGGSGSSNATDIALDALGNIYVTGQTNSGGFPTRNAFQNHPGGPLLFSSADGGQTWTSPSPGPGTSVQWIAASGAEPAVLYAATSAGVIKSTDGGSTWSTPANAGLTAPPVAVAVDADSARVYAASSGFGIFTSANGGASWSVSTTGLIVAGTSPPSAPQFRGLYAAPGLPGVVFAIGQFPAALYRSIDAGRTWTQLTLPSPGGAPTALAFSTTSASTLFLGRASGAFLTSTDDGYTWTGTTNESVSRARKAWRRCRAIRQFSLPPSNSANWIEAPTAGNTWTNVLYAA